MTLMRRAEPKTLRAKGTILNEQGKPLCKADLFFQEQVHTPGDRRPWSGSFLVVGEVDFNDLTHLGRFSIRVDRRGTVAAYLDRPQLPVPSV